MNRFFSDKSLPFILGHRGVPLVHQENTMAGFHRAVELGLDGIELDVFKTYDNKIVVFHDENTERLTGVKGDITRMTWDEISKLRIQKTIDMGDRQIRYPTEERIPLLAEVLEEFKDKLLINIEMKAYQPKWSRRHTGTEVAHIIRQNQAEDSVIITSFDFFMLYYLESEYNGLHSGFAYDDGMLLDTIGNWHEYIPEIHSEVSQALGNQNDLTFLNLVLESNHIGKLIGSTLVDAEYTLLDSDTVQKFHHKKMLVGTYTTFPLDTRTIRFPDDDPYSVIEQLIEKSVDWIESDDPEKMMRYYQSRN